MRGKCRLALAIVTAAATAGGRPSFAAKQGYHFSEVRAHQFVEAWPSLNPDGKSVHLKVKVSNGVQIAPFHPTVVIDFVGAGGQIVARYVKDYSLGPSGFHGGVDRTYDYDIARPDLWASAVDVTLLALERPPANWGPTIPLYQMDDPLKCLGNC